MENIQIIRKVFTEEKENHEYNTNLRNVYFKIISF